MSILQVVKGCPIFYELYDQEIMKIVGLCRVLNLEPGDHVFKNGDTGNEIFLLLQGSASVMKGDLELAQLRKGDLFGEMVLLKENVRNADIRVNNFADVLVMDYEDIFGLYERDTKIFSILMLNLSRMLATRLNGAGEMIGQLKRDLSNKDKKAA
ncbi:MAG: cyclic nucleotide-binding domain-containing protein [Bacteriovoracaceae bacterium]